MYGSGGDSEGFGIGSKRPRMMESNPYFAVSSGYNQCYGYDAAGYYQHHNQPCVFPVVRLRGLPFNCTETEILKFFSGLEVVDVLLANKNGRFSGEGFVVFSRPMQADLALQRDRQNIGRRYVEVFRCKKMEYYQAVAAEVRYNDGFSGIYGHEPQPGLGRMKRETQDKDQMEYTEVLKLRGLPFSVRKSDIVEFFEEFKVVESKVHIACWTDGRTTGEAYVEFASAEEAKRAMCKDKMMMGSRYVELFPSTPDEARLAESRSRQ